MAEQFGYSVSLSSDGQTIAVGARSYSHLDKSRSGRVQVFTQTSNQEWVPVGQTLYGRQAQDQLGYAVSLSSDGTRLAVSEPNADAAAGDRAGIVRVFDLVEGEWQLLGQELSGQRVADLFGMSLVLSGNGQVLAVGSPYHDDDDEKNLNGRVRVFYYSVATKTWQDRGIPLDGSESLDWFGWDVDLNESGTFLAVGAPRNTQHGGYVRCFSFEDTEWRPLPDLVNSDFLPSERGDRFGTKVSVHGGEEERPRVAIGAPWKNSGVGENVGLVAVYEYRPSDDDSPAWTLLGRLEGQDSNARFGWSFQLAGDYLTVASPGRNQVSVYKYVGPQQEWDNISNPLQGASGDEFGFSVACSANGQVLAVGATQRTGTGFVQVVEQS